MLRLSDAPKLVMHDIDGCFESPMNLGLFRGRQKRGGGKSLRSTFLLCMALSFAPIKFHNEININAQKLSCAF